MAILICLLGGLAVGVTDSAAYRELLKHPKGPGGDDAWLVDTEGKPPKIEGACGLAVSPSFGSLYVSDYYHRAIDIYSAGGLFEGSISLPGGDPPPSEINTLDAACGLAFAPNEDLYVDELHQGVSRFLPDEQSIDAGHATGLATDSSGDVYVNDRTYIAVYEAPIEPGEDPVEKIGSNNLEDGYGLAVDSASGTVYVADAADDTVKGYVPKISSTVPQVTIAHDFVSLVNAAIAVDPTNGHVLMVDDLQPGFEDPEAAVYEFGATGEFLDRLSSPTVGAPGEQMGLVFGEPSGIAVDPQTGDLYVTIGNSVGSNVAKYGPFSPFAPSALPSAGEGARLSSDRPGAVGAGASRGGAQGNPRPAGASTSVLVQRRGVRVSFDGKLTPQALPRHGVAPVGIAVDAGISASNGDAPPQLRKIAIAINRNGRLTSQGLPICRLDQIQPSTSAGALAACRNSLVGEGHFSANVKLPQQSPFPSDGKVLAFNGRIGGKPAILAHIYGTQPAPTSTVLPFLIKASRGTYGTVLETSLPQATGNWGYVTGLKMSLRRRFSYSGRARSYLSAGCPAPAGFPGAVFPLARTSFAFAGGLTLESVVNRSCKAKG